MGTKRPSLVVRREDKTYSTADIEVTSSTGTVYVKRNIDRGIARHALAIVQGRRPNDVWKYLGHMKRKTEGVSHE